MPEVRQLHVGGVTGDDGNFAWLQAFPNLESLSIANSAFTDRDFRHLKGMRGLKYLTVISKSVSGGEIDPGWLPATLVSLNVMASSMKSGEWIGGLPQLLVLTLDHTQLTPAALSAIDWPDTLETLCLRELPVDDRVLARLAKHPNLTELRVTSHLVDEWALQKFTELAPQIQVGP